MGRVSLKVYTSVTNSIGNELIKLFMTILNIVNILSIYDIIHHYYTSKDIIDSTLLVRLFAKERRSTGGGDGCTGFIPLLQTTPFFLTIFCTSIALAVTYHTKSKHPSKE